MPRLVGYGAEDTERLVSELAGQLGLADVQVSSLPTQLQLAIGIPGQQRVVLLRTTPMPVDLDRIVRLDAVAREVKAGRIGPREASVRIDAIARSGSPYPGPMVLFAYCLAAAGTVLLFGEDLPEALTAAVAGLAVGAIALVRTRVRELDLAAELLSSLIAGFISQTVSARIWPLDPRVATLGAVVVLLPGFTLTQGVRELQTRNLLSGLAGLGAAAVTFLALVIGAVLGGGLGARLFGPARVPPVELPDGIYLLGAAALGLAAVVVLRAPRKEAPTVVASALLAAAVSHAVSRSLGSALGAFVGAVAIGLVAHLNARLRARPVCARHHPRCPGARARERRLQEPPRPRGPRRGDQHRNGVRDGPHRGRNRLRAPPGRWARRAVASVGESARRRRERQPGPRGSRPGTPIRLPGTRGSPGRPRAVPDTSFGHLVWRPRLRFVPGEGHGSDALSPLRETGPCG